MARRKFTPEQIISKLREVEVALAAGIDRCRGGPRHRSHRTDLLWAPIQGGCLIRQSGGAGWPMRWMPSSLNGCWHAVSRQSRCTSGSGSHIRHSGGLPPRSVSIHSSQLRLSPSRSRRWCETSNRGRGWPRRADVITDAVRARKRPRVEGRGVLSDTRVSRLRIRARRLTGSRAPARAPAPQAPPPGRLAQAPQRGQPWPNLGAAPTHRYGRPPVPVLAGRRLGVDARA